MERTGNPQRVHACYSLERKERRSIVKVQRIPEDVGRPRILSGLSSNEPRSESQDKGKQTIHIYHSKSNKVPSRPQPPP